MVHCYHEYQSSWQASLGKKPKFVQKVENCSDVFAIAVVRVGETVRHFPRKISSVCSILFQNGGEIVR